MKRIAIIGGGIAGLSAAFAVERERNHGAEIDYVLFESNSRCGGVIRTEHVHDCLIEAGPDSFLTEKPWATDLCRDLGLGEQLLGSNDAQRKTYIALNRRLVPIPPGLSFMVPTELASTFFSPLFSWKTKLRILREWFYKPRPSRADVTVNDFVERHYGHEMVERVADPLLAGVYGASADELSVKSVLPRFLEMESAHGSLGKAMVAARKRRTRSAVPLFTSLRNGMQQMVDSLVQKISPTAPRLEAAVRVVKPESGKWLVVLSGQPTEAFDAVVLATPAYVGASLLSPGLTALAAELSQIRYTSSVTVALIYDPSVRAQLPPGFGFLLPRTENRRILATTFVHNKFPHRAPQDRALLRCFLGGSRDEAILQSSDHEILSLVGRELGEILGIRAEPLFTRIYKWKSAMARYHIGHAARVDRIREIVGRTPGLALAGNAYRGIGVSDCVRSGSEAAAKVLADVAIVPAMAYRH
jgi:protoporphyrinogen/coproporphyrinogen III oxidase